MVKARNSNQTELNVLFKVQLVSGLIRISKLIKIKGHGAGCLNQQFSKNRLVFINDKTYLCLLSHIFGPFLCYLYFVNNAFGNILASF